MVLIYLGMLVILLLGSKALLRHIGLSPIVGYLLLGLLANILPWTPGGDSLRFLAQIGIILLLFHIGLESHPSKLLRYAKAAGVVGLTEMTVTFIVGGWIAYLFGLPLIPSLLIGLALSATSMGVATGGWKQDDLAETKSGLILLDLAMIDDILSIFFMALLFGIVGIGQFEHLGAATAVGISILSLIALIVGCYLFAHFVEPLLTKELIKYEKMPDSMLSILGIGLLIAGVAAFLDFSFAIGAFLAGIAFSRDPRAVRINISMRSLLDLFVPFFFFWIGYRTSLIAIADYWFLCLIILITTLAAKLIGTYVPARWMGIEKGAALLVALSMIPRAEVTMVIMEQALDLHLITDSIYSVVSIVALVSCLLSPIGTKLARITPSKLPPGH